MSQYDIVIRNGQVADGTGRKLFAADVALKGDRIAGGAYDYIINGNMIAGFGLLAWPVTYGETGVKTFAVNQNGIVYEVDLGPATEQIVKYIDRFDPGDDWKVVAD